MNETENYKDILIVHTEGMNFVVAAPAFEAKLGELVEFRTEGAMNLFGPITDMVTCKKFDETWSCISRLARIHNAVAIYNVKWSSDHSDT